MKKVLFTLMLFLFAFTANARTEYTATSVACSINGTQWSDWLPMSCLFVLDQDNKQVRIYSDIDYSTTTNMFSVNDTKMQIIDYGDVITTYGKNAEGYSFRKETIKGRDSYGAICTMYFFIFNDGDLMFNISYHDIKYKYMLKRS